MLEIGGVASRQRGAARTRDGRYLCVPLRDRAPCRPAGAGDSSEHSGGVNIEWQNAIRKVFLEHLFRSGLQGCTPLALHQFETVQDFGLSNRRRIQA